MRKEKEQWRPVPNAPGYEVSDLGRVRKLIAVHLSDGSTPVVNIIGSDGVTRGLTVAHVVASAFLGPRPSGAVVVHRNGVAADNRPENLEYTTQSGKVSTAYGTGAILRGPKPKLWERHPNTKLSAAQVREIRKRRAEGERGVDLAAEFEVSPGLIYQICRGRVRTYVQDDDASMERHRQEVERDRETAKAERMAQLETTKAEAMARYAPEAACLN